MQSPEVIRKANTAAVVYLEMRGYMILEQNLRRPRIEISIVAKKGTTLNFIDVVYRLEANEPSDIIGVSPLKIRQMKRIDEIWREETKWDGASQFSQIEIVGSDFIIMNFIENAF